MDSQPYDDRHDNPYYAQTYYPEVTAPDTIPQWVIDQTEK